MTDDTPLEPDEIETALKTLQAAEDHTGDMAEATFSDAQTYLRGHAKRLCGESFTGG